ncbi:PAS domain S-box protein [Candidatus Obscuribacterales bacterium]|nr:PAS domain S-box protein [Candidatus Obscuribacterales bacterium]
MKSEDIYRCLLDECADGFVVSDSQGLIVSVNAALAKLVGKDAASLKGQPLKSIINFEVPDTQQKMLEASVAQ